MDDSGIEVCDLLPWDTNFFGFRIGRIRGDTLDPGKVTEVDNWCQRSKVRCLYFLARSDDPLTTQLAEKNGYQLVDICMTLEWKKAVNSKERNFFTLRNAQKEDAPILRNIARKSYYDTRFFYNNNFPIHLSELLYETWILRSIEGFANCVLVAVSDDDWPIGYISCHLKGNPALGQIGLVGVQADQKGRGIGEGLVHGALDWFDAQETQKVIVVTQGRNSSAQRLYQRCYFLTKSVQLWYHKWYPIKK